MKVTNLTPATIYLDDLKITNPSQGSGRRGEDRYIGANASKYLPNTSEVLRSAISGDIRRFVDAGKMSVEDVTTLAPNGSIILTHNFHFPPGVVVLKQVDDVWVDGTGTVDIAHNATFTEVELINTTAFTITFLIRLV